MSPPSLSPTPTPNRHRAHSTNLRPALTINTLGRRRSTSLERTPVTTSSTPHSASTVTMVVTPVENHLPSSSPSSSSSPSVLAVLASRFLELLHVSPKHSLQWSSTPSSPRSSTDEYILPMSASSQQTTFGDVFGEKELSTAHASTAWWQGHPSVTRFVS